MEVETLDLLCYAKNKCQYTIAAYTIIGWHM